MRVIINIRGTGGSGKSTIVRSVMERYSSKTPAYTKGRKQPIGYLLHRELTPAMLESLAQRRTALWVPGHYETPCGGCDTIKTPAEVFQSVKEHAEKGYDVLFEGIICQDDTVRTIALPSETGAKAIIYGLLTPIEECLAGIQSRRDARKDVRPLNPQNTVDRAKRVAKTLEKLRKAGMDVRVGQRDEVLAGILKELGL